MDRSERRRVLGEFLMDRRKRVRPEDVGILKSRRRRVQGLRREEVATLSGVGVRWYTMLETGRAGGVSAETLSAIALALCMTPDETAYIARLADDRPGRAGEGASVNPSALGALDAITGAPAYIITSHWVVRAWNAAFSAVWGIEAPGGEPFNIVIRMFQDRRMRAMHGEHFVAFARSLVAMVRGAQGAFVESDAYQRMCNSLRDDPLFVQLWNEYDVAIPMRTLANHVTSQAVGKFAYTSLTLDIAGTDDWLVVQVPMTDSLGMNGSLPAADSAQNVR